jgi:AraC-like DNA-binding protein
MECKEHYSALSDIIVDHLCADDHLFRVNLHYHNGYELFYFARATAQLLVDNQVIDIHDGDMLLIKPFIMHTAYQLAPGPYERYYINLASTSVEQFLMRLGMENLLKPLANSCSIHLRSADCPHSARQRMMTIHELYNRKRNLWQERLLAELALLLADLVDSVLVCTSRSATMRQDPFKQRQIYRLLAHIDEHFREGLSLTGLEQQFFLSRYYICRLFRQETGLTLSQYINRKKVSLAQQLLKNPDMTITAVCREAGFNFPQHFTAVFKAITGLTPSAYRRSV